MATAANPCDANIFSQILGGNAIDCSDAFKSYLKKSETQQIQSVADNASSAYGDDSITSQVTAATAKLQINNAGADVDQITEDIANSKIGLVFGGECDGEPGADLTLIGGPCIKYSTLKWIGAGLAVFAVLGVFLYAYSIAIPFLPRRG